MKEECEIIAFGVGIKIQYNCLLISIFLGNRESALVGSICPGR
jgi:hypothetical protein